MDFSISQEIDVELEEKSSIIADLSCQLKEFFLIRNYGKDINHFYIGVICVKPEGEMFFKVRKPRYKAVDKVKLLEGKTINLIGVYGYYVKLDFEEFVAASEVECKNILAQEILRSLSCLDFLPRKIKDFNKDLFKQDIEKFFKSKKLI